MVFNTFHPVNCCTDNVLTQRIAKERQKQYNCLKQRIEREKELFVTAQKIQTRKDLMVRAQGVLGLFIFFLFSPL